MLLRPYPDWTGETVAVVASGHTAKATVKDVSGYPTVVINRSFELVPDADVLYAADAGFWNIYGRQIREFKGLKISPAHQARQIHPSLIDCEVAKTQGIPIHHMQDGPPGYVGHGGNSGFQAVNLVAQWGAKQILLVGFDYCGSHWHEDYDKRLRNPSVDSLRTWCKRLDNNYDWFEKRGIDVVNLSPRSALRNYRRENSTVFNKRSSALPVRGFPERSKTFRFRRRR